MSSTCPTEKLVNFPYYIDLELFRPATLRDERELRRRRRTREAEDHALGGAERNERFHSLALDRREDSDHLERTAL